MFISGAIGIIADDLTGANDTALQFHFKGCNTQVILDYSGIYRENTTTQAWALSTESRNIVPELAVERVEAAAKNFVENYNIEHFYKKIDSTLRGNIALETMKMLEVLNWDAALILPAFPNEGRTTIGGYQLLKGVPIQLTEVARDPVAPINESNIITLLKSQLSDVYEEDLVGLIPIDVVMKGAAPILFKINELIAEGKKLIVSDAVSTTDIEQVVLATEKCSKKILPCGSAGAALALSNIWLPDTKHQHITKTIPSLPKLIVSGSATELTSSQLSSLRDDDDFENLYFIDIKGENVFADEIDDISERAINHLKHNNTVVINTSNLFESNDEFSNILFEKEITKKKFSSMICDYLGKLTQKIVTNCEVILITVGGETSYKCCKFLNIENIQLIDTVVPAVPLGLDTNGQWIVTKSGNLGNQKALVDILKYFEQYNNE